jgi:hypothetical protein
VVLNFFGGHRCHRFATRFRGLEAARVQGRDLLPLVYHAPSSRSSFSLAAGISTMFLMLAGCSGRAPTVIFAGPNGPVVLNSPSSAMPGGQVGPPPGMEPMGPAFVQSSNRSGSYTGSATVLASNGYACQSPVKISGFHVNGNAVRFGGFRGRIDPYNGLQMANRGQWIVGQFDGATFNGQITFWSNQLGPRCTYLLNLQRTGA